MDEHKTESAIKRTANIRPQVTPQQKKRKKIMQILTGIIVFIGICVISFIAQQYNSNAPIIILIGVGFGYTLQRARFCFTACFRDPVLTGSTQLTKALIIGLAVSTFVFMIISIKKAGLDVNVIEMKNIAGTVKNSGLHTAIGAFIFGIGAVIAGGCASGTLMRMGEGFLQQWIVIVFFVMGSVLGAWILSGIKTVPFLYGKVVFLPKTLGGWLPAAIVQFSLFLILYILADIWGKKKAGVR